MKPGNMYRRYLPRVKKIVIAAILFGIFFYTYTWVVNSDRFKIKTFNHTGIVKFVNKEDFEKVVNSKIVGQNILFLNQKQLEDSLLKNFLGIKFVVVSKNILKSTIRVSVQERVPTAVVIDSTQTRYLIDLDGYVLGLVEASYFDLPTVNYDYQLHVGQFVDKNIAPIALEIIYEAKVNNIQLSSMSFKQDLISFYSGKETLVYFNSTKSVKYALKVVANILAKSILEAKNIAKIDLRYDKVIVSYR